MKIKYPKDTLAVIVVVIVALLAVSADGLSDFANKPFWWKFWEVVGVICFLACVGGWIYLAKKDRSSKDQ